MNRFKFESYKQEFPALNTLLLDRNEQPRDGRYCDSIKIARVSRELLSTIPTWTSHDGSCVGISKKETISFLLKDGTLVRDAVRQEATHGSNYAHTSTQHVEGETVLEAIDRHGCSILALVFLIRTGFVVRDHYSEPNFAVTIYKPAREESIVQTIAKAAAAALTEVRAEANF